MLYKTRHYHITVSHENIQQFVLHHKTRNRNHLHVSMLTTFTYVALAPALPFAIAIGNAAVRCVLCFYIFLFFLFQFFCVYFLLQWSTEQVNVRASNLRGERMSSTGHFHKTLMNVQIEKSHHLLVKCFVSIVELSKHCFVFFLLNFRSPTTNTLKLKVLFTIIRNAFAPTIISLNRIHGKLCQLTDFTDGF